MQYKIDYDFPTKEELKQYLKDALVLVSQNKWLSLKLVVASIFSASIVGAIMIAPLFIGISLIKTGYSPEFLNFFYEGISGFFQVLLTTVPFWIILFFTGFRLMENRQSNISIQYLLKTHFSLIRHFWSKGIMLLILAGVIAISALFGTGVPEANDIYKDSDTIELLSAIAFSLVGEGMQLGVGFYWFPFIHVMIFSALLFGKEATPNLVFILQMLFLPKVSTTKKIIYFISFVLVDALVQTISYVITLLVPGEYGHLAGMMFSGLYYLMVAGIFYCFCVDKIEGRKLKKKVKEETFSGSMAPSLG